MNLLAFRVRDNHLLWQIFISSLLLSYFANLPLHIIGHMSSKYMILVDLVVDHNKSLVILSENFLHWPNDSFTILHFKDKPLWKSLM